MPDEDVRTEVVDIRDPTEVVCQAAFGSQPHICAALIVLALKAVQHTEKIEVHK